MKTAYTIFFVLFIATISIFAGCKTKTAQKPVLKPNEEWHLMRNYPDEFLDVKAYKAGLAQATSQLQRLNKSKSQTNWVTQGPYNTNGRINTIAHNPGNDQIIYIGSVCGGIFKTDNGGESWKPIFDEQAHLSIAHIVVSPHDTNTLYVATGDPNISSYPWVGNGLYKSTDAGVTWENIGLTETGIMSKIAVHPTNPDIIYAATMGVPFVRDTNRGLYKTIDGGQNWEKVLFLSEEAGIIDMVLLPNSPDTLFVAGWNRLRNYNENISSGSNCKVYRTFNGGETWDAVNDMFQDGSISRIGLSLSLQDSVELVAQYVGAGTFETEGIYISSDFGDNWDSFVPNYVPECLGGFGWYFGKIRMNPKNAKQMFLLGVDLYRTDNRGESYEMSAPSWASYEVHADKHDLVFVDSSTLLLATDGGVYKSSDNGHTWVDIDNTPTTQFYRVTVDPFKNGFYCGGAQDNGTNYGNVDDSLNWEHVFGGDGFQALFDWQDSSIFYCETQNGNLFYRDRSNGEEYWDYFNKGLDVDTRVSWDMPFCMSPLNSKKLYAGTYRIYRHEGDISEYWELISDDLTSGGDGKAHVITALDASHFYENEIITGSSDGRVHVSVSEYDFVDVSDGLPERYVTDVLMSENDKKHLFVTHSGYKANEYIPHIHFSSDMGLNWKDISGNLPQIAINSVYSLYGYGDSVVFVGTDGGVYHTLNQGDSWERSGNNMPIIPVYDLAYDDTNHTLVAATFARAIMTLDLAPIINKKEFVPKDTNFLAQYEFVEIKVYPNPAESFVTITTDKNLTNAIFKIFGANGELAFEKQLTNEKQCTIDISSINPGVYIVNVVKNEKVISVHKLIVQ